MWSLNFNILTQEQKEVFKKLVIFKEEAVLAGGTALAVQIQHRQSFDFDLFFFRELNQNEIIKLRRSIKIKKVGLNITYQINIVTTNNILLNLVYYPFKPLFKKIKTFSLSLLSIQDIALDKAYTIGRRATWRDYVDLFFLLKDRHVSLQDILTLAPKKFGPEFNERLFLEQLIYFKDLETTKISFLKECFSNNKIKQFLINEVKKHRKKFISI